jgi:hypothetical protein
VTQQKKKDPGWRNEGLQEPKKMKEVTSSEVLGIWTRVVGLLSSSHCSHMHILVTLVEESRQLEKGGDGQE